jgi:hypothetical protein
MRRLFAVLAMACITLGLMAVLGSAQMDKGAKPSPAEKASCALADGKSISVDYSSPRAKGRKIYGGLVPYGQVWRAGANEATTFVTNTDVTVGGKTVPAGEYTLFVIPSQDKWTLIISKKTKNAKGGPLWGTDYPGEGQDLIRVDMKATQFPSPVENFTIAFDKMGDGCVMRMDWETTRASVDIGAKK